MTKSTRLDAFAQGAAMHREEEHLPMTKGGGNGPAVATERLNLRLPVDMVEEIRLRAFRQRKTPGKVVVELLGPLLAKKAEK